MQNSKIIYTCIVGNYDTLKTPTFVSPEFDYVCFTDNPNITSDIWEIRSIPEDIKNNTYTFINRYIKWFPNKLFPKYDFSIYVDGSMKQINDLNQFIENNCNDSNIPMYLLPHNKRKCVYEEFIACARGRKDDNDTLYKQMRKYFEEGLPFEYGLSHNCILFRYHNHPIYKDFANMLWDEMTTHSMRDQLSTWYVIWKLNIKDKIKILNPNIVKLYFDYENSWKHDLKYYIELEILNNIFYKLGNSNLVTKEEYNEFYILINKMFKAYM